MKRWMAAAISFWALCGYVGGQEDVAGEEVAPLQDDDTGEMVWQMEEVVVTPTRQEEKQFEHPYTAYALSHRQLQNERMARTTPESLQEVPGVMVQKTAHGQGSPYIRGFTGFHTLFMIDGIRLNNSVFREGPNQYWNTVDFLSVERLEIVKGPSSALYGSDAIGGTVNAIPIERTRYEEEWEIDPRAYYRFASSGRSHTTRIELSGNYGEDVGFVGGFFYKNFGDIEAGSDSNLLPRTGYYELGGDMHVTFFPSESTELEFAWYTLDQNNVWRTHSTIFSKSFHGTTVGTDRRRRSDQEHHLGYARFIAHDLTGPVQEVSFTASWQYQGEEEDRVRSNLRRDLQQVKVNTMGIQAQASSETECGVFSYGMEYYRDFVDSSRTDFNADGSVRARRIQGPVADNANYDLLEIYVQDEITLFEALSIVAGARYTHAWIDADRVEDPVTGQRLSMSDNWGQFTGNLRASLLVEEHWRIFGGVSQGFRTPNLSDMTRFDSARTDEIETPVRDLDPENFLQYEVGVKANYESLYCQGSYYYTQIFDMIIRFPTGRTIQNASEVTKANEGDGFVHGVELEAGYYVTPEWLVHGGFAWMEGIVATFPTPNSTKKDEPIDRMQPATGFIGVRWQHESKKYWAEGVVTMVREQHRLSTRDRADTQRISPDGTPGYATLTLRGGVKIDDNITVSAAVENIGDKDYRAHGSGQNESGINAIFAVDVGL